VLVPEEGVTVVTDMDDTIKVTNILDQNEKIANTFLRPFNAVPGMPELYRSWKNALGPRIHFHVVSAGPWQFHEPLRRFTEEAGFPPFTWDMRSVDIGDIRVLLSELSQNLDTIYDHKVQKIRALMSRFPKRHVVLVGDSGERDPEVYAMIVAEFMDRVDAVFIRNVHREDQAALQTARYKALFSTKEAETKLRVFADPKDLPPLSGPSGGLVAHAPHGNGKWGSRRYAATPPCDALQISSAELPVGQCARRDDDRAEHRQVERRMGAPVEDRGSLVVVER
jgi:phosphatidate phosphatase APP1